jgi:ABC-2 type transport system permease protein
MRNIWTITYHTQLKLLRNPSFILVMFVMPMLLIYILGSALADDFKQKDHVIPSVRIAIASNHTQSVESQFQDYLNSLANKGSFHLIIANSTIELEDWIVSKKADMGLIVNLSSSPWKIINGSDPAKNVTGRTIIDNYYNQWMLNEIERQNIELKSITNSQSPESGVEVTKLTQNEKRITAMQYYSAVNIVMYLLYTGMGAAISLINEREHFTLSRLNAAPIPNHHIIIGVILGNGIFAILQSIMIIIGTTMIYGVNWGHQKLGISLILSLVVIITLSIGTLVGLYIKTVKAAIAIFQALISVMTFVSGGFVANLDQFKWFAILEKYTINYWAVQGLLRSMMSEGLTDLSYYLVILSSLSAVLLLMIWFSYRKVGYYE